MDLSIVTVNWNVKDILIKCLDSIFKYTKDLSYEVIVVDNASNDNSIAEIRKAFSQQIMENKLVLIENKQNLGFSKANNIGWKESKGDYVLFMNPDMEFLENTPQILINEMKNKEKLGAITCNLLYGDKTVQPNVKNNPTFASQFLIELKLHHVLHKTKSLKNYLAKDFDYAKPAEVFQIMGAFVLMPRKIVEEVNGWDEDYWLWWEDVDLCKKIHNLGYKIYYTPSSKVVHYEGKSFEQVPSVNKQKRFIKGMLIYFSKHGKKWQSALIAAFYPLSIALAYVTQKLKIKPKPQSRI